MSKPLYVAFIWHMHQPYYRDLLTDDCHMPWVRLHAAKDYLDMVKRLEAYPALHMTVNVVPSLLDQLEAYLPPANRSDQFLDVSRKSVSDLTESEKQFLLRHFFMSNWDRMVKPYPRYHDLLAKRGAFVGDEDWPALLRRFKLQDYLDLQVWFNLAWIDPWLRQQDQELVQLEMKGSYFTEADKQRVLEKQLAILQQVIPVYRAAQDRGQIELTTSPYYHPIMPLLCQLRNARVALPQLALPEETFGHPEDAAWHLREALARHEAAFGQRAQGIWPPEGSVSEDVVHLAIQAGIRWIATDEEILWRTLRQPHSSELLYRPHPLKRPAGQTAIVFRDRELSDLIGFVYSQWTPEVAVRDFLSRLEVIRQDLSIRERPGLVSVILDGENAWEFYSRDGEEFLQGLYRALADDERFRLVTVSEYLTRFPVDHDTSLPDLFAGSWIDSNFATWIGHPEKNKAWSCLARVRQELVAAPHPPELAWKSFYIAEGSDWMWWYGDTHSSAQDEEFDRLFRMHLANVYRLLNRDVPEWLQVPIKTNTINAGCEPTAYFSPIIDGVETTYYEWLYAGRVELRKGYGAMHRGNQILQRFCYGCDQTCYYVRLDLDGGGLASLGGWRIELDWPTCHAQIVVEGQRTELLSAWLSPQHQALACAYRRIVELAIPRAALPLRNGERHQLRLALFQDDELLEQYPPTGAFGMTIAPSDFDAQGWSV